MEPEILEAGTAIKGLALLSAIPIVSFALWGDYFISSIKRRMGLPESKEADPVDLDSELLILRLAGTLTLLAETVLYLGSPSIRESNVFFTYLIFVASILAQILVQNQIEENLLSTTSPSSTTSVNAENSPPASQETFTLVGKLAFSWALAAIGNALLFFSFLGIGIFVSEKLHLNDQEATLLILTLGAIGIFIGLIFNLALGPLQLKKAFSALLIQEPKLKALCESCFLRAGLTPPTFWMMDIKNLRIANPLLSGLPIHKGLFKRALFIPLLTLNALTGPELEAILLNQVSHLVLKHLKKRILLSLGLILTSATLAVGILGLAHTSFNRMGVRPGLLEGLGLLLISTTLFIAYRMLARQNKIHLFEADLYCINILGVRVEILIQALIKLDQLTEGSPLALHPETDRRIKLLQVYCLPEKAASSDNPDSKREAA